MSSLKRLFSYKESKSLAPLENFTTEALAVAVKSDPSPILDVLGRHGIVSPDLVTEVMPFTQVHVMDEARVGYVDLVLQVGTRDGPHEVWVENKVWAPESGSQLTFYSAVIAANTGDGVRRHLAVLAPKPISAAENHTFISWTEVAATANDGAHSLWWTELAEFLEEIGLSEDTSLPITAAESASLGAAHQLFTKVRAIMARANAEAIETVPEWSDHWWPDSHVTRAMTRQFVEKGRYTLSSGYGQPAFVVWGAVPKDDGVWFVLQVEAEPRRTAARSELLRAVEGQLPSWSRPHGRWSVIEIERRAVTFESDDEAVGWFLGRLRELQAVGVFRLIPSLGQGPVIVEGSSDVGDGDL